VLSAIKPEWIVATSALCWAFTPGFLWFAGRRLPDLVRPRAWSYLLAAAAFPFWALAVLPALGQSVPSPGPIDHPTATYFVVILAFVIPLIDSYLDERRPAIRARRKLLKRHHQRHT
jgi:hypothetical protein